MIKSQSTPSALGYVMPAEWAKHEAVWLAWPHDPESFPGKVKEVEQIHCQIIAAMYSTEKVNLIVKNESVKFRAIGELIKHGVDVGSPNFNFYFADYADVWIRDYCPTFLTNRVTGQLGAVRWRYNGYGNKFPELLKDDLVADALKQTINASSWFELNLVMESGSFDVNGRGTLVTTEECLLNPNRNPQYGKIELETILKNYLGVRKVIWIKQGVANDPTDGHIDDFIRFVDERTLVCAYDEDVNHPNQQRLASAYRTLCRATDQDGRPFKVVKLPMPQVYYNQKRYYQSTIAPASYANFYIGNRRVLVPIFRQSDDDKALSIIADLFPQRKAVGINCRALLDGGGAIHCVMQQQPAI